MANKYIIHGATFDGDGTSSAEATSNGGVGAWNNINILTGTAPTYGTLAAGDTVYIRTKSSAGADISVSFSVATTVGSANATAAAWITWVFDDGVVWSGVKGIVTYTSTAAAVGLTFYDYNSFISTDPSRFKSVHSTIHDSKLLLGECYIDGLTVDWTAVTGNTGTIGTRAAGLTPVVANLRFKTYKSHTTASGLIKPSLENKIVLINPEIEITYSGSTGSVFVTNNYTNQIIVYGGRGFGAGFNSNMSICGTAGRSSGTQLIGFQYPIAAKLSAFIPASTNRCGFPYTSFGADGELGAEVVDAWGYASSRNDGNFPTLNATLPDSASTPWSWWAQLVSGNMPSNPMIIPVSKYFTDAAAAKKITLEILVSDTFASQLNKSNTVLTVVYTSNATGLPVHVSSKSVAETPPALDTSTAAWSTTTYGSVSLLKRKLEVTTPDAIKQNTPISVFLTCSAAGSLSSHILFVCPDPQLTTP